MRASIRLAEPKDISALIPLCAAHAAYEKSTYDAFGKAEALKNHLFGQGETLQCLVVEMEGKLLGYATYMKQFSTWDAAFYVYLDCLYLDESLRGMGMGKKLMSVVKDYANAHNCTEIQWQTPDFNENAIGFYKHLGGLSKKKERFFWNIT